MYGPADCVLTQLRALEIPDAVSQCKLRPEAGAKPERSENGPVRRERRTPSPPLQIDEAGDQVQAAREQVLLIRSQLRADGLK